MILYDSFDSFGTSSYECLHPPSGIVYLTPTIPCEDIHLLVRRYSQASTYFDLFLFAAFFSMLSEALLAEHAS